MEKASLKESDQRIEQLDDKKQLSQVETLCNKVPSKHKYPVTQFDINRAREAFENKQMMASTTLVAYYHTWCSRKLLKLKAFISDSSNQLDRAELKNLENDLQELENKFSSLIERYIFEERWVPEFEFTANGTFLCIKGSRSRPEDGRHAATDDELDKIKDRFSKCLQMSANKMKNV